LPATVLFLKDLDVLTLKLYMDSTGISAARINCRLNHSPYAQACSEAWRGSCVLECRQSIDFQESPTRSRFLTEIGAVVSMGVHLVEARNQGLCWFITILPRIFVVYKCISDTTYSM